MYMTSTPMVRQSAAMRAILGNTRRLDVPLERAVAGLELGVGQFPEFPAFPANAEILYVDNQECCHFGPDRNLSRAQFKKVHLSLRLPYWTPPWASALASKAAHCSADSPSAIRSFRISRSTWRSDRPSACTGMV